MQIFIDAHPKCRGEELHAANWKPPTPPKEITRDSVEGFGWEVRGSLSTYYSVFSSRTLRACPLEGQRIYGKRGPAQTQSFVWVRTGQDRTGQVLPSWSWAGGKHTKLQSVATPGSVAKWDITVHSLLGW